MCQLTSFATFIDGDEVTSYEYDIGNRLRKITNHKNEVFSFEYDAKNRLSLISRPGSETSYSFYDNDVLSQILHKSGTSTISSFDYVINGIGNITKKRTPAGDFDYGYDGNNQLSSASNPETLLDEVYQYDSLGNRTADQSGSYSYDQTGQKLQEDYKNLYYYDSNGNLSSKIEKSSNKVTNYIYNSENRLVEFKEFDASANLMKQASYAYDALGRRIEKVVTDLQVPANNKTRRYVYDGEDILLVLNENNETLSKYTHSSLRIDDALAIDDKINNKSYYFLKDHLGSVVDIVNEDQSVVQHYAYSAFGKILKISDGSGNDISANPVVEPHFTYTGREWDAESSLYHYRARAYDAETGRFLQRDPHPGFKTNHRTFANKYIYTLNNPTAFTDPSGKFVFTGAFLVVAIYGSATTIGGAAILGASLAVLGTLALDEATNQGGGFFDFSNSMKTMERINSSSAFRREILYSAVGGALGGMAAHKLTMMAQGAGWSKGMVQFTGGLTDTFFTSVGATAGNSLATEEGRANFGSNVGKAAILGIGFGIGAGAAAASGLTSLHITAIVKEHSVFVIMEMPADDPEQQ